MSFFKNNKRSCDCFILYKVYPRYRAFTNRRVLIQNPLHLEWRDSIPESSYYVVFSSHNPEIPILILVEEITAHKPVSTKHPFGFLGFLPVSEHNSRIILGSS